MADDKKENKKDRKNNRVIAIITGLFLISGVALTAILTKQSPSEQYNITNNGENSGVIAGKIIIQDSSTAYFGVRGNYVLQHDSVANIISLSIKHGVWDKTFVAIPESEKELCKVAFSASARGSYRESTFELPKSHIKVYGAIWLEIFWLDDTSITVSYSGNPPSTLYFGSIKKKEYETIDLRTYPCVDKLVQYIRQ